MTLRLYPYFQYKKPAEVVMAPSVWACPALYLSSVFHIIYIPALLSEKDFISRLLVHIEESH
jgi:hypothetical protein